MSWAGGGDIFGAPPVRGRVRPGRVCPGRIDGARREAQSAPDRAVCRWWPLLSGPCETRPGQWGRCLGHHRSPLHQSVTVGRPLTASTRSCAAAAAAGAAAAAVAGAVAGAAGAADGVAGAAAGAAVGVHVGAVAVTATVAEAAARQATLYQEQLRPIVGSDSWRTVFCALPPFYLMIIVSAAIHNVAIHNNWAKMVVCWV